MVSRLNARQVKRGVSRFLVFSNRALIEVENQYATAIS
jgi:hypothetical protein